MIARICAAMSMLVCVAGTQAATVVGSRDVVVVAQAAEPTVGPVNSIPLPARPIPRIPPRLPPSRS